MKNIKEILNALFEYKDGIFRQSTSDGYWSNLSKNDHEKLFETLKSKSAKESIRELFPQYYDMIFDNSRSVGLPLLEINSNDIGIDYGCMWGNLLVNSARKCKAMVGVNQTIDSLIFLNKRLKEEKIDNCFLVHTNLREELKIQETFDFAIVNGVLEWIPERDAIDLKSHFKRNKLKFAWPQVNPKNEQLNFLKSVNNSLKKNGKLYLAIENRYDYKYFLWKKDPHSNLHFTTFLPRFISNIISNIWYGRPYCNYIYSARDLKTMLNDSGFKQCSIYVSFPDYHFPKRIIPYKNKTYSRIGPFNYWKKKKRWHFEIIHKAIRIIDYIIFQKMKLYSLAPAFIIIAQKNE